MFLAAVNPSERTISRCREVMFERELERTSKCSIEVPWWAKGSHDASGIGNLAFRRPMAVDFCLASNIVRLFFAGMRDSLRNGFASVEFKWRNKIAGKSTLALRYYPWENVFPHFAVHKFRLMLIRVVG